MSDGPCEIEAKLPPAVSAILVAAVIRNDDALESRLELDHVV